MIGLGNKISDKVNVGSDKEYLSFWIRKLKRGNLRHGNEEIMNIEIAPLGAWHNKFSSKYPNNQIFLANSKPNTNKTTQLIVFDVIEASSQHVRTSWIYKIMIKSFFDQIAKYFPYLIDFNK